jgi:hypothetical protein
MPSNQSVYKRLTKKKGVEKTEHRGRSVAAIYKAGTALVIFGPVKLLFQWKLLG